MNWVSADIYGRYGSGVGTIHREREGLRNGRMEGGGGR